MNGDYVEVLSPGEALDAAIAAYRNAERGCIAVAWVCSSGYELCGFAGIAMEWADLVASLDFEGLQAVTLEDYTPINNPGPGYTEADIVFTDDDNAAAQLEQLAGCRVVRVEAPDA